MSMQYLQQEDVAACHPPSLAAEASAARYVPAVSGATIPFSPKFQRWRRTNGVLCFHLHRGLYRAKMLRFQVNLKRRAKSQQALLQ
mmetsp:Transcript_14431/g.23864  ORF Transcript_14431/g.23864 Transcript_14431/m.23864 type:complete len:86 (+) Transcript_14431:1415-1672(+)